MDSSLLSYATTLLKSQTIVSTVYLICILSISCFLEINSLSIADSKRFACKGVSGDYKTEVCLKAYNIGPNGLQSWLYSTTSYLPLSILILGTAIMFAKVIRLKSGLATKCKFHIHQYYYARMAFSIFAHFTVVFVVVIFVWILEDSQLVIDNFTCLYENSTIHCVDGKAKSRSDLNITCLFMHCFFFLYTSVELVYYVDKWRRTKTFRGMHEEGVCKDCDYFIEKFTVFAGMFSFLNFFLVDVRLAIPLLLMIYYIFKAGFLLQYNNNVQISTNFLIQLSIKHKFKHRSKRTCMNL